VGAVSGVYLTQILKPKE